MEAVGLPRFSPNQNGSDPASQVAFLEQVYLDLRYSGRPELSPSETAVFLDALPENWTHGQLVRNDRTYTLLRRPTEKGAVDTSRYHTSRRLVGWDEEGIVLLIGRPAISDIGVVVDIENSISALTAPNPFARNGRSTEASKLETSLTEKEKAAAGIRSLLTTKQLAVVSLLHRGSAEIALELDMSINTVRAHVSRVKQALEIEKPYKVAVLAAAVELLPIEEIPVGKTEKLTERQKEVLASYYRLGNYQATSAHNRLGPTSIQGTLNRIYKALDVPDRKGAMLVAFRDGLIEPPDLSRYTQSA